MLLHVNT